MELPLGWLLTGEAAPTQHLRRQEKGKENSHQCYGEGMFSGQFLPCLIPEAKQTVVQEGMAGSLLKSIMTFLIFTDCCPGHRRKTLKKGVQETQQFLWGHPDQGVGSPANGPSTTITQISIRKNFMDLRIPMGAQSFNLN